MTYLDHAATTPLDPDVLESMMPFLSGIAGNPSSVHAVGRIARSASDDARESMARILGCEAQELVITSGGTESDNLAIKGSARASVRRGRHVVTSAIEHHAVLHSCASLEREGFDVSYLPVDEYGVVSPEDLAASIRDDTILVSIMLANNEIGTIQRLSEMAAITRERGTPFHTDAVQAAGHLEIDVDDLGVDLLSLSAHKFYGPRGVGLLYVRDGVGLDPLFDGGGQELERRSGTENIAGTVGMARALGLAMERLEPRMRRESGMRDILIEKIQDATGDVILTGHPTRRLPSVASFCFRDIDAESLLINLDLDGIQASSGSACTSGSVIVSHVIQALGLPEAFEAGSLRLSVGDSNTPEEIAATADIIIAHTARLRDIAEEVTEAEFGAVGG